MTYIYVIQERERKKKKRKRNENNEKYCKNILLIPITRSFFKRYFSSHLRNSMRTIEHYTILYII